MYKRILVIALLSYGALLWAAQATVTITKENTGGIEAYSFSFTKTAAQDTAILVPSGQNYFNADDISDVIAFRFDTNEATADSVRFNVQYQAKIQPSDSWVTVHTFVDTNSTSPFLNVMPATTYGKWPIVRFLMIDAAAKTAAQTVTGQITFDKD